MKQNYLFPSKFRMIGYILLVPFTVLGALCLFGNLSFWSCKMPALVLGEGFGTITKWFAMTETELSDEWAIIGLAVSLLFIAFAKEKDEDECIAQIRARSLTWAVLVNFIILILGTLLIYDLSYFSFLCILQFLVLVLFIIKYQIALCRFRRIKNEE